ncbi:MAG: VOC family protein [Candidatus Paceibacterota bacterium]
MNRVVHFEIHAENVERAKKFYGSVFGWTMQQMGSELGNYVLVVTGPGPDEIAKGTVKMEDLGINGGMLPRNAPTPPQGMGPNAFVCTISVDDIDAYIAKADSAGGVPQTEKMDVPGIGPLIYYKDTEGNIFGMLQPIPPTK